ncbi:MAG: hypothetical protein ACYCOU_12180, partial [Sulfobacillus sp.]
TSSKIVADFRKAKSLFRNPSEIAVSMSESDLPIPCHCAGHVIGKGRGRPTEVRSRRGLCCWCSDRCSREEIDDPTVHLDFCREVRPRQLGLAWPKDIWYCPKCRHTRLSSAQIYQELLRLSRIGLGDDAFAT